MTANTVFRISELDFDDIKANLKDYLRGQARFQDYDFDGSSLNILLDVLAYNTAYNAYYLNMIANESFLDTAVLRDSIISKAKHLGYVPTSSRSPVANVTITVTPPPGDTTAVAVIPKYFEFQSEAVDGINYTFITPDTYTATKNSISGTFTFSGITINQGERVTYNTAVTSSGQSRYILPSANVDTSTIKVAVQQSSINTYTEAFTLVSDLNILNSNSKVYFLEAVEDKQYALYFGDGYLGKQLSIGNIIQTNYIITNGLDANKARIFTPSGSISGFSNVSVLTNSSASGGADPETDDAIKFRAPIYYTAQNRAVTLDDYSNILLNDYPNVEQINVWGGEDNDPIIYGKVFISMKPRDGFAITNTEKERIINDLIANRNIVSIITEIVDPVYLYIVMDIKVYFDPKLTTLTAAEISEKVRLAVLSYTNENLGSFGATFKSSRVRNVVDTCDPSINDSELRIRIQKRFTPDLTIKKNYEINFHTTLHRGGGIGDKITSYPTFTIKDSEGIDRVAYIEEAPYSYTGIDSVKIDTPGVGYTSIPTITITGDGTGATAIASVVNGKVVSISVVNRGSDYTRALITISGGGGSGATTTAVQSLHIGKLRVFYYDSSGSKVIINDNLGAIDYRVGKMSLINFNPIAITNNPFYANNELVLTSEIGHNDRLVPTRNNILVVDDEDALSVQVTAIEV